MNKKVSREFKDGEIVTNKASAMKKLNDDALLLIFNCLRRVADKIRIERVCKKWQNLVRRSWSSTTYLDFSNETWAKTEKGCMLLNKDIVTKVGMLCGQFLTSVSLSMPAFLEICKFNLRIQELHLYDIKRHDCSSAPSKYIDKKVLERIRINAISAFNYERAILLSEIWDKPLCTCAVNNWPAILERIMPNINHNIVKFYLELNNHSNTESYKEEDLANLLASMHKVKTVSLQFNQMYENNFRGTFLNQLSFNTIEEITLSKLDHISNELVSSTIQKCKNLRKIVLDNVQDLELDLVFIAVSTHAKTLKHLFISPITHKLFLYELKESSKILLSMSKLIHLEKLQLYFSGSVLCDKFIKVVSKHCLELTRLDLLSSRHATDEGFSDISSLKKLRVLSLRCIEKLTRLPLEQFKFLEILKLQYCPNFKDESLCSFLENAYYLRVLNVNKCSSISDKVVRAAVDLVQRRTSNIELLVYDSPNGVFVRYTHKLPTLINVIFDADRFCHEPDALEKYPQVEYNPNYASQFQIERIEPRPPFDTSARHSWHVPSIPERNLEGPVRAVPLPPNAHLLHSG